MKTAIQRMEMGDVRVRVASLSQLDELVGKHVTGESPKVSWEDSNSLFQFESKAEAQEAIQDSYYRMFDSTVDWDRAEVVEVKQYHPYSSDLKFAWQVVEQMSSAEHPLEMRREGRHWLASFGKGNSVAAQTPPLAICLAGLRAHGIEAVLEAAEADEAEGYACEPRTRRIF